MTALSIIIPLGPGEKALQSLLTDLAQLPNGTEILLITSDAATSGRKAAALPNKKIRRIVSKSGRARHMNAGAKAAKGEFLWFLHADSKFAANTLFQLSNAMQKHADALLYFDLAFLNDASPLMFLNAWGVYLRSRLLKVPFGDQGFCIQKSLFTKVGGYPEDLAYGEDHVFVWRARQHGIEVLPVGATLFTSARKYKRHGWLKTTLLHQYLWIKQAWPEWKRLRNKSKNQRPA